MRHSRRAISIWAISITTLVLVVSLLGLRRGIAFEEFFDGSSWNKPVVGVRFDIDSCADAVPPVGTGLELDRAVRGGITAWENTGADFHFEYRGETALKPSEIVRGDPVFVYCRSADEDDYFVEFPMADAHAPCHFGVDPLGGYPFLTIDACAVVMREGLPWRYSLSEFPGNLFVNILIHEFGHVAGLDHSDTDDFTPDPFGIMERSVGLQSMITGDDSRGFTSRRGTASKLLQTARATVEGTEVVVHGGTESLYGAGFLTMASPSASGNPLGADGAFDYAVAYLQPQPCVFGGCLPGSGDHQARRIVVSLFDETPSKDLELLGTYETPFFSIEPPAIAVGGESPSGVGIAYTSTGAGLDRELHFAVSYDVTEPTAWEDINLQRTPIGGPALSYSPRKQRWTIAWIQFNTGGSFDNQYKIGTIVSSDFTGLDWVTTGRSYDNGFSMHHGSPAMACSQNENRCVVIFNQFESPDIKQVHQRAFQFDETLAHLDSLDTFPPAGDQTYGGLDITRWEDGYLYTSIRASAAKDNMRYHLKTDATTTEIGPWFDSMTGETSAIQSRGRVAAAYNWRTGDFRFFWIP